MAHDCQHYAPTSIIYITDARGGIITWFQEDQFYEWLAQYLRGGTHPQSPAWALDEVFIQHFIDRTAYQPRLRLSRLTQLD